MTAAAIRTLRSIAQQAAPEYAARTGRYPNFDILRLLLALEVVFVHAWDAVDPNFSWAGLIMAVPAFLGISGFLVLQSYSETASWIDFLKKRALRVLPALLVSLALCFALFDKNAMINSFLLWLSGGLYHVQGFRNTPLWSLAWEELAYLCLALLWVLGAYRRPFYLGLLLILAMGMVWAASSLAPASRLIFMLAPAFLIGNLMYLLRGKLLSVHPLIPWLVFYVMIEWRYVPSGQLLGGGVLLALQVFAVVWVGMSGWKLIRFKFPDLSYGFYVYHFPIIIYIKNNFKILGLAHLLLTTGVVLIPLSLISWYAVEKPLLSLKKMAHP